MAAAAAGEQKDASLPHAEQQQHRSHSHSPSSIRSRVAPNGAAGKNRQQHHYRRHQGRELRTLGSRELGQLNEEGLEDEQTEAIEEDEKEEDSPSETLLLYGKLEVHIDKAKELPHTLPECFTALTTCRGKITEQTKNLGTTRSGRGVYVVVSVAGDRIARTRVKQNPVWHEDFLLHVAHFAKEVVFSVKDEGILGPRVIGRVRIPAQKLVGRQPVEGWFPVLGSRQKKKPIKQGTELYVSARYLPVEQDPGYEAGVGAGPDYHGVPNVYFPLRKGCRVVLYQDAHVSAPPPAPIRLENGAEFERRKCWEELCRAIVEAHHIVYVAGWAVYDKIKLVRGGNSKELPDITVGELLKRKAGEGVRVVLLVWNDKTSHRNRLFKIKGVMGTHDEETKRFFKHSAVKCVLAPRYGDHKLSWFRQKIVGTVYTHHQKLVIVDTQGPGNSRKLSAFVGGLDLCDGRYDTQEHSIFNSLTTVHKEDCYNATFTVTAESGGPRQPWHDQHCMIDGPAAYDCLKNFEQRWSKTTRWHEDALVQIGRISWILGPVKGDPEEDKALEVTQDDDPETWHVQIFRSIDSGSVKGFPKRVSHAVKQHLVCGKNICMDKSIHMAYVERIRSAQHFVYIENQYFLGSSYSWPKYKNAGATHLVPMELALKIAAKIRNNERFAAYVVIPMWPEGAPDSASGQEILFFQSQTMEMMYTVIANALKDTGLNDKYHPKDYLNFYCLGNREVRKQTPEQPPSEKSKQYISQQSGRFLIYVHAKSMVVDDEYVIIGSANINQRSMDGCRDTEIAMGAYQPHYTWARKQHHPHGQVYGHRMSLWAEHLACIQDSFEDPAKLETVHEVNRMAEQNWQQYVAEEVTDMKAHLMPYPVKVNADGKLEPLPGFECFPDVGGKVMGSPYGNLPDEVTT